MSMANDNRRRLAAMRKRANTTQKAPKVPQIRGCGWVQWGFPSPMPSSSLQGMRGWRAPQLSDLRVDQES